MNESVMLKGADLTEAENIYVAACIRNPKVYYQHGLTSDNMTTAKARNLLKLVGAFLDAGKKPEDATLIAAGGDPIDVTNVWSTVGDIDFAIAVIQDRRARRILQNTFTDAIRLVSDGESVAEALSMVEAASMEVISGKSSMPFHISDKLLDHMNWIEARYQAKELAGIPTGFAELDQKTGGFQKEQLWILAARPSCGKTALVLNMALTVATGGKRVGIISAESTAKEMITRILTVKTQTPTRALQGGYFPDSTLGKIVSTYGTLNELPIFFYDRPGMNLTDALAAIRYMVQVKKVDIVFVDYLQKILNRQRDMPRHEQVAEVSSELKFAANRLGIPIVCAAQLNRETETSKRSELHNLSASAQIEMDGDVVVLINHQRDEERRIQASWLDVAKARDGETGPVRVLFDGPSLTFRQPTFRDLHKDADV